MKVEVDVPNGPYGLTSVFMSEDRVQNLDHVQKSAARAPYELVIVFVSSCVWREVKGNLTSDVWRKSCLCLINAWKKKHVQMFSAHGEKNDRQE